MPTYVEHMVSALKSTIASSKNKVGVVGSVEKLLSKKGGISQWITSMQDRTKALAVVSFVLGAITILSVVIAATMVVPKN